MNLLHKYQKDHYLPTKLYVYPYNMQSTSARNLAGVLGVFRIRQNGNYRHRPGKKVVNWGNGHLANWMTPMSMEHIYNKPQNVELASSKLETLQQLSISGIPIPDFTDLPQRAKLWLQSEPKYPGLKHAVLCRTLTRANSGRGIVIATIPEQIVSAPLYTRYVPKQDEYRVHVFREFGVIDVQQKRRDSEIAIEERDPYIRNHDAGWVFCRENVHPPQAVLQAAENAVMALGLDFGAVDIGFHNNIGPCVYEVNTAPGLEGQTLTNYAEAFQKLV
mgnify:FL=1